MKTGSILAFLLLSALSMHGLGITPLESKIAWAQLGKADTYAEAVSNSYASLTGAAPALVVEGTSASGIVGVPFSFQILTDFNPTWYSASGLPPGFLCDGPSGVIHGTPTGAGTYSVHVEARDLFQSASGTIIIAINHGTITQGSASGIAGVPFSFQILTDFNPTWYSASGLPSGFLCDGRSGVIHGTPTGPGTYSVHVEARDLFQTASATISITVNHSSITSGSSASGIVGVPFSFQILTDFNPTWYSASGLPPGFLCDGPSGVIHGTPTGPGTYSVHVEARDLFQSASATISITISSGTLTGITSLPFTLHAFTGGNDGGHSQAGLVQGSDGFFYGTTANGGTNNSGTVFKISANGVLTSLHLFTGTNDGANPQAGLVQGSDGSFYGTARSGGTNGDGTVFRISANGLLTNLYSFGSLQDTNGLPLDGANPQAGLALGSDGFFYGTTFSGGTNSNGTVFRISANGLLTSLYSFGSFRDTNGLPLDGANPQAGLALGSDGFFYGTTFSGGANGDGTVFQITSTGVLTILHSFTGKDGANPEAGLVQGSDGNFYGTTYTGGAYTNGILFRITTNGALTALHSFTGTNDGGHPRAGLIQGSDGNLYGTAYSGGPFNDGTVFRITTNGALTTLHTFTGATDGANPQAGLVQGSDGSFYGTTANGGQNGVGTVLRLPNVLPLQAVKLTNSKLNLTWSTKTGGTYQLQYKSDLSSVNWTNLGSAATAASGTTFSFIDSSTNGSRRFYRLVPVP